MKLQVIAALASVSLVVAAPISTGLLASAVTVDRHRSNALDNSKVAGSSGGTAGADKIATKVVTLSTSHSDANDEAELNVKGVGEIPRFAKQQYMDSLEHYIERYHDDARSNIIVPATKTKDSKSLRLSLGIPEHTRRPRIRSPNEVLRSTYTPNPIVLNKSPHDLPLSPIFWNTPRAESAAPSDFSRFEP